MTNKEALCAYIAGVADSDGSFSVHILNKNRNRPSYSPIFQLTWKASDKTKEFFDILVHNYGGNYSKCMPSSASNFANSKPVLKYYLGSGGIEKFINDILPFLFLKRQQARNLLRLKKVIGTYKCRIKKTDRILQFQKVVYERNKSLNTKNGYRHAGD